MKAAVLHAFGEAPRFEEFADPVAGPDEELLQVRASALSHLARGMSTGRHYVRPQSLPTILGLDGIGTTADGRRVYASVPRPPYGMLAERTVVPRARCVPVPDRVDDATAAALPNAALASWLALAYRAPLAGGERVLILGATGVAGKVAIPVARHLGASRIVAAGRNPKALAGLPALGADAVLSLGGVESEFTAAVAAEHAAHPIDVVLDFLWGRPAELTIAAFLGRGRAAQVRRIRFVSIGAMAGDTAAVPSAPLRSSGLELLGSGIGSVSDADSLATIPKIFDLGAKGGLAVPTRSVPLAEIGAVWAEPEPDGRRLVVVP